MAPPLFLLSKGNNMDTNKNLNNLDVEEQRAIFASAIKNANKDQLKRLEDNNNKVIEAKQELVAIVNEILGTSYTTVNKIIFTQTDHGIDVSTTQ